MHGSCHRVARRRVGLCSGRVRVAGPRVARRGRCVILSARIRNTVAGVQADTEQRPVDAEWTPDGALCVDHYLAVTVPPGYAAAMAQPARNARIASTAALVAIACLVAACGHPAPAPPADPPPASDPGSGAPGERPGPPGDDLLCDPAECGPPIRMPSRRCPDGSIGGPTGRCLRKPDRRCAWEVRPCPPG